MCVCVCVHTPHDVYTLMESKIKGIAANGNSLESTSSGSS